MSETIETQGYCDEKFAQVRDVLAESLRTDADIWRFVAVNMVDQARNLPLSGSLATRCQFLVYARKSSSLPLLG